MRLGLALIAVVALCADSAWAQAEDEVSEDGVSSALEGCKQLTRGEERLTCYDRVLGRGSEETPSGATAAASKGSEPAAEEDARQASEERTADTSETTSVDNSLDDSGRSLFADRWQLTSQAERGPFVIVPYKPTYLLPVSYDFDPNEAPYRAEGGSGRDLDSAEVEFQVSFKAKLWPELLSSKGDLWFGYTQRSYWQAYKKSSPFRETNFEPELIYSYQTDLTFLGLENRLLTLGVNHQSNGRSDPLSRSWNRITAGALLERGHYAMRVRGWYRLPAAGEDDNPGITDYIGHGEIWQYYKDGDETWALMLRSNFEPGDLRGAVQVDYTFGLGGPLRGYVKAFHGYGDGLIDYDDESTRLGLGVMLLDWL